MWEEVLLFLVPFWSQILTRFDVILDFVIFAYFYAISIDFYEVDCFILLIISMFFKWEKAYIKDFNAGRFLMNFSFIYLDEGRGMGGGGVH